MPANVVCITADR